MYSPLVLKLFLVPTFIGLISLAGRHWGPTIAGWLTGLPALAGPILFLLWLEHGAEFARGAALYSLAAVAPVTAYTVVYAWSSRRWAWPLTSVLAYGTWLLCALIVLTLPIGIVSATVLCAVSLIIVPRAFPRQMFTQANALIPKFEIEIRMLAGAALTLLVTSIAAVGGTRVSGILPLLPVLSGILAISIHRSSGSAAVIAMLKGFASGLWSLAAFCATLVIIPAASAGYAFGAATLVAIGVQTLVLIYPEHVP